MKRIFIIPGALIFVATGANAANVINGNPLYSPAQGRFYNVFTPLEANSEFDRFVMADEFGYGITDNFTVMLQTAGSYDSSDNPEFGKWSWNHLQVGLDWSVVNDGEYQADIYGRAMQVYDTRQHLETIAYNWTVGTQFGRVTDDWTVAGVVEVDYLNDDVDYKNADAWAMTVGIQGQYIVNDNWNWVGELMFDFDLFDEYYDGEQLRLKIGANYNLDATKYIGWYVQKDLVHGFERSPAEMGVVFGVDF
ncbi:MAG: hypothetical protein R8M37_00235 [Alphaproteobacteria bacterium]|nr:hypothetical protein [Alphaproteobacteria bacterium]